MPYLAPKRKSPKNVNSWNTDKRSLSEILMTDYSAYDQIYDSRPIVRIHKRLRSSGTVKELIDLAKKQDYRVEFCAGSARHDLIIYTEDPENPTQEPYTLVDAVRYFRRLNDS